MSIDIHRCRFVDFNSHTVTSLAFSHKSNSKKFAPNELRLAVGRNNGDIEIWNPKKWIHEFTLYGGKEKSIEGLVWASKEGELPRLFSIGGSTFVTEWDLSTGLPLAQVDSNSSMIWSISINENQDKISLGCDDGTIVILDISGGPGSIEHYSFLQRQDSRVLSLTWKHNDYVIGGCADGKIKVWDVKTRGLISAMRVDKSKKETTLIWSVAYLPVIDQIVSGDSTGTVKFWQVENYTLLQSFKVHEADVLTLSSDLQNESLFSAGVDRKIFKFQYVNDKWIINSNRLFHSNDIRSITSYESKNFQFLISGGVEKTIVINSIKSFIDGQYKKISQFPQNQHFVFNKHQNLIIMWNDNLVKIWRLDDNNNHKLVAKMTLSDDDNISTAAISPSGEYLAIGRLTTTKLFKLTPKNNKLLISKVQHSNLLDKGSTNLKFYGNDSILLATPNNEIFQIPIDSNEDSEQEDIDEVEREFTLPDLTKKSKLSFLSSVNNLCIHNSKLIVSRICGAIDIIDLDTGLVSQFLRLSNSINKIELTSKGSLIVITSDNKIYEFELSTQRLSEWSTKNSEFLPYKYLSQDTPIGLFYDQNKLWIYGVNYLSFFDLSLNIPFSKKDKKRKYSGVIGHLEVNEQEIDEEIELEEDEDIIMDEDVDLKESNKLDFKKLNKDELSYWMTYKYKPLLFANLMESQGKDTTNLLVVERARFDSGENSFKLNQYRI
ncbi:hypothetical protein WICMUC_004674 [Wickerhamomyces mucosus]|uniref:Anaphase-promoting complex subunit 4 WD40 domain-containing protein n=1 Tax=Wickerhamomyces mucosus TaxID=1378264 RepID=A0A9P8PGE2_9ASCO|nr:hypothetical protein WICMUC_004674 [Wickerhamomyces mucosus]